MRWISEQKFFEGILSNARENANWDTQEDGAAWSQLVFDSSELLTCEFLNLLAKLMDWSGDKISYYIVLDPDPVQYFAHHFKKYPLLEIRQDDSCEAYLAALNEDPGGSPADAVGINWNRYSLLPPSGKWFISAARDDDRNEGARLWIPHEWIRQVIDFYPCARVAKKSVD
jgi:hypothetical protein